MKSTRFKILIALAIAAVLLIASGIHANNEPPMVNKVDSFSEIKEAMRVFGPRTELTDTEKLLAIRERVFNFSRSPNNEHTVEVLREARNNRLLSENEYYGELAHMLTVHLEHAKPIIQEIVDSQNGYGLEVMFWTLQSGRWIEGLSTEDKNEIFDILSNQKPTFAAPVSGIGMSELSRYSNWIQSMEKFYTKGSFYTYLSDFSKTGMNDPREIFAIADAGYFPRIAEAQQVDAIARMTDIMKSYTRSYPETDHAQVILRRVASE